MLLLRSPVDLRWRECVAPAKKFGKREQGCLKTDVFIEDTRLVGGSKRMTEIYART